jgi:DNA-binding FrmR family transcriptional regulator
MSSNKKQVTDKQLAKIESDHEYMHAHSIAHTHADTHTSPLTHSHEHENTKAVLNRMSRAIGHMEAIKTMIADGRDCSEVLVQIAAVRSAINNIGKIILEDHINHCVVDAVETGNEQVLKDLQDAINKFVK